MTFNIFQSETNKILIDNTSTANTKYIGIARCGASEDKEEWKIIKDIYDDDGNLISSMTYKTFAKWTDRTNLCY